MPFKKIIITVLALFILTAGTVIGIDEYKDWRAQQRLDSQIDKILHISKINQITDFHEKVDAIRTLVNEKSIHKIDDEFYSMWRDQNAIATAFIDHINGNRHPPHMECSTRTGLLSHLLERSGYRTRTIYVFRNDATLSNHTFLEVQNPETKIWESQDADYDIYWRHKETKDRASIVSVTADIGSYEPCNSQTCGWDIKSREDIPAARFKDRLSYVTLVDRKGKERLTLYAAGIDPEQQYKTSKKEGNFCDILAKNCRDGFISIDSYKE